VKVKICGITRPLDARRAADLGADAIGLNFWPGSKRCVSPAQARAIVDALPPFVWAVGVFVNQPRATIRRVVRAVGLHAIQLHGDEAAGALRGYPVPVLKAVRVGDRLPAIPHETPLIIDAAQPGFGGGGVKVDWTLARRIARHHQVLLAGGLTPANVGRAIEAVGPWGVDVASGVESAPGIKDPKLLARFIRAARRYP
jgi:phosphoribosylanthranilate isomerase